MAFHAPEEQEFSADSPEQLFTRLPRTNLSTPSLWLHQGDILRTYVSNHLRSRDLAIELPTGTGKTLPGLLIADWNRRSRAVRVVYACPTVQLVRQVMRSATREGLPVVDLSGSWRDWDEGDELRFEQAQATAVVTYSTVFNSNPHLSDVDLMLFDDAHAGEQYVSHAYSLDVTREQFPELFNNLLGILIDVLPGGMAARYMEDSPDPLTSKSVNLVLPESRLGLLAALSGMLASGVRDTKLSYPYSILASHLGACGIYVSWASISVRPFVSPTEENALFSGARQRIYLSATLGEAGELERAFGRSAIKRLPLPASAGTPRSGRRFVVFPTLVPQTGADALTRDLIAEAGRAIIITPSAYAVQVARQTLVPDGWTVFTKNDVELGFDAFAKTSNAVCILANRYDGLDLPNDACRAVVLFGHPTATHLQERFLASRARAMSAMAERIRGRVIQGTGRATRGPQDYALVVVADHDMARYLARPEIQKTLDADLQAEVQFGLRNSRITRADVMANVKDFFAQADAWQSAAEPHIARLASGVTRAAPQSAPALLAAAPHEVAASQLAWQGSWHEASVEANLAADAMNGEHEIENYRAFWLLLAAYFENVAARVGVGSDAFMATSQSLLRRALEAAQPTTWIRELTPLPGLPPETLSPWDAHAVNRLADRILSSLAPSRIASEIEGMKKGLAATTPSNYEPALCLLGGLLGSDAYKPSDPGNADSAWCWANEMWVTIEAKSDESPDDTVSIDSVRQANTQLDMLAADRGVVAPPGRSAAVLVTPRKAIDPGAVAAAQPFVFLTHVDDLQLLAHDTAELWDALLAIRHNNDRPTVVAGIQDAMTRASLLPSHVFARLTEQPVSA